MPLKVKGRSLIGDDVLAALEFYAITMEGFTIDIGATINSPHDVVLSSRAQLGLVRRGWMQVSWAAVRDLGERQRMLPSRR